MIQRILLISDLLLIALAVYGGVGIFYSFLEMELLQFSPAVASVRQTEIAETEKKKPASGDYAVIARRDLFHTKGAPAGKMEPESDIAALKKTDLKLKLWGTVSTEDRRSGMARAVIEALASKDQSLYRVGDTVENARIAEILRNGVVLDINGRKEKLTMEERVPGLQISAPPEEFARADILPVHAGGAERVPVPRAKIDRALDDITRLKEEVKIRPFYLEGEAAGFVVANIDQESVIREIGLKSGDVVTRINGQSIQSGEDAMALYESLKSGDTLTIELMRRGRTQVIEYVVQEEMLGGK